MSWECLAFLWYNITDPENQEMKNLYEMKLQMSKK